jgi:hypothetical protein
MFNNIIKIFIFTIIIFSMFGLGFSTIQVNSCQTINESILDIDRIVVMNESIYGINSACFLIKDSDYTFDCQGNTINSSGFHDAFDNAFSDIDNITIKNCNLEDGASIYLRGFGQNVTNLKFMNINITGGRIYLKEYGVTNNLLENLNINYEGGSCLVFEDADNNEVINSFFNCGYSDLIFYEEADNNIFVNNIFEGGQYNIRFSPSTQIGNIFVNNTFRNISSIIAYNWSQTQSNFSYGGFGNTYMGNYTFSGKHCFDEPANLSCDYFSDVQLFPVASVSTSSVSNLPSFGIGSALVVLAVLLGFII